MFDPWEKTDMMVVQVQDCCQTFLSFKGLSSTNEIRNNVRFLHPMSALVFRTTTILPDFSLEVQDTLLLYQTLKPFKNDIQGGLQHLDPTVYFNGDAFLRQKDVIDYENKLKGILLM